MHVEKGCAHVGRRGGEAVGVEGRLCLVRECAPTQTMTCSKYYLLLGDLARRLDAIAALDHIRFEADGPGPTVEFEEEAAGITQN